VSARVVVAVTAAAVLAGCGVNAHDDGLRVSDDRRLSVSTGDGTTVPVRARYAGDPENAAWVFTGVRDRPDAPVVVFLHDWGSTDPRAHGPWIAHLVRRGADVIFPTYQVGQGDLVGRAAAQGAAGVRTGLAVLGRRPRTLAYAGYGVGGALAADVAASARARRIPPPGAVLALYPSRRARPLLVDSSFTALPVSAASGIPPSARVLALAGAADTGETQRTARAIVAGATAVPRRRRRFEVVTDPRISVRTGPLQTDAIARRTFWRALDRMIGGR
jgi:acetyl esterase/lipase